MTKEGVVQKVRGRREIRGKKYKKEVLYCIFSLIFCVCMRERVEWAIQAKPCYVLDGVGLSVEGPYGP